MIRFVLRTLGLIMLVGAFFAIIIDGTRSIGDSTIYISKFSETWAAIHQQSLMAAQAAVEKSAPWLWSTVIFPVIQQPTWLVLGTLGFVLILLGRRKKPLIGYAR
jgi:hypothetical protein